MIKTLFAATALLAVSMSPAFAKSATKTFVRDGESYSYSTIDKGDHVLITGRNQSSGSTFELNVQGDVITGTSGGVPVSFMMPGAQAKLTRAQLASR